MAAQADIEAVRDWCGDEPDDDTVAEFVDRLVDPLAAALAILRRRRANIAGEAQSFTVFGDYAQTTDGRQVAVLDGLIAHLESLTGVQPLPIVTTARIWRADLR